MRISQLDPADAETLREEWVDAIEQLMGDVRTWAEGEAWAVKPMSYTLTEEVIGTHSVPGMQIETPAGTVELEPIGRDVIGAQGRVDFYAWPSLRRVILLRKSDHQWAIHTDFGPKWPHPWSRATFIELAKALLDEE